MSHFKQFVAVVFFILAQNASPNEDTSSAKSESSQSEVEFSGQQDESWMQLQTELGTLKTKLDAEQALVNELLINKKNQKSAIRKDQIDQLNQHHKKLIEQTKEYNQKLSDFEQRYPEKGQALGRQYNRRYTPSLGEMENTLTLEGRIQKINKKIKTQYSIPETSDSVQKKMPKTDAEKTQSLKKTKPAYDVTDKIIMVK